MSDKTPDKKSEEKKEIVIDLGGAFFSASNRPRHNTPDTGQELIKGVNPDSLPSEMMSPLVSDSGAVQENEYDGRHEFLRKASTQVPIDPFVYGISADDLAEPLYNQMQLVNLNEISYVRNACINAIARNTVGLGYRIKKVDPDSELYDTDEISEKIKKQLEAWASRDEKTFTELMFAVKYDEETTGNGYIEVSRNRRGEIDGLYHVPAYTMRLRRDRAGYVQEKGMNKVAFYRFGDKVKLISDGSIKYLPDREDSINEIIHFKLYSPRDLYYGVPRDTGTYVTIAGDEQARNHNVKFFTHSAVPDLIIAFEVDESALEKEFGDQPVRIDVPDDFKFAVMEHFRRSLSSQSFEPGIFYLPQGVKMNLERISQGQKDAGWVNYRKENRAEIRMAFGVPPVILGDTEGSGYATAAIEKGIFLEQIISPEQLRYSERLMGLLWPEMLGVHPEVPAPVINEKGEMEPKDVVDVTPPGGTGIDPDVWRLEFTKMAVMDQISVAQTHNIYGALGVLNKNEMRQDIGRKPIEEGDEPAANKKDGEKEEEATAPPVPGTEAAPPDPNDIRGLAGRPGGGRGANGTISNPMPRRPMEDGVPVPANAGTVGQPGMSKRSSDMERAAEIVKAAKKKIQENSTTLVRAEDSAEMPPRVKEATEE